MAVSYLLLILVLTVTACSPSAEEKVTETEARRICVQAVEEQNFPNPSEVCDCTFKEANRHRPAVEAMRSCMVEQM